MDRSDSGLNEIQKSAKDYITSYKLEDLFTEMLNGVVSTQPKEPIVYMV